MRPPWLRRWLPLVVGLAVGLLLARLVMDAMGDMEPAPDVPVVLVAGYLTCVVAALAVTFSWGRISSGRRAAGAQGSDDSSARPTSPDGSDARPVDEEAGDAGARPTDAGERPSAEGSRR